MDEELKSYRVMWEDQMSRSDILARVVGIYARQGNTTFPLDSPHFAELIRHRDHAELLWEIAIGDTDPETGRSRWEMS